MKVRNEKNESLESTPIGKPVPYKRLPLALRSPGCTLSHQKSQYSCHVVGICDSWKPASFSMSIQYSMCIVCCLSGNA